MKKRNYLFRIIVLLIVIFPIVFWGASLAKCEILTFLKSLIIHQKQLVFIIYLQTNLWVIY